MTCRDFLVLDEAGVKVLLYTFASRPVMEGNTMKGVIIENKSGRQAILAKIVIDASGCLLYTSKLWKK